MHNSKFRISFLAICVLCLLWGPIGCGGDEEPAPGKPAVVATKIKTSAPKRAPAKKPAPVQKPSSKPAAKTAATGGAATGAPETSDASVQKTMADIEKKAVDRTVTMYRARLYNPEGKIDPFENPFKKLAPSLPDEEEEEDLNKPDRIRQTPLEKIDLSQLALVGVIKFASGYKAIVEEQSGKGYMIKVGTYIGTNYGQVSEIQNDRIVIQEKVKDILGKYKDQTSQLKLQKPLGEN